ncbi:MAG TPA: ABC transporter ATP-binding protein [Candidatus Saccharimonadales bacterium]|nr:ABC transporter ATP-binding protein [Candidatus Saccharimonadales bacterium]
MPIIQLKDVSKLYGFGDATNVALEEINLDVNRGEMVAVMGPSGSGKSTLMNIIGLLDRPTHGEYYLNGRSVSRLRPNQQAKYRRDTIGFVFQSFNLLPKLNVLENVALPLTYKGITQTRRLKRASTILELVGLRDREYYMPKQLSGGQAQRVAIARALVNNPHLIIADEPTGNLDSESSRLVMELLSDIHADGNTILIVTHNPEVTRFATRVVFMRDGIVVADEQSAIGEVPKMVRRNLYFRPQTTIDDQLAGVSSLMKALPQKANPKKLVKKRKPRSKKATYKPRVKKAKARN